MTKYQRVASKTIVIQPGSVILRIGLATDEEPKTFLHCIARLSKTPCVGRVPLSNSENVCPSYEPQLDSRTTNLLGGSISVKSTANDKKLYKLLNSSPKTEHQSEDDAKPSLFIPFLRGFRESTSGNYELQWPLVSGRFNDAFPTSLNLQNLQDMWTYALEKYFDIPKETFHLYSVILVIEDIFLRREVRLIINMLLLHLHFARVVAQQSSVCSTYGVGLPTACVVDLGFQKTSVACVDEGISLPDVRIKLPIGVSNCFNILREAIQFHSQDPKISELLRITNPGSYEDTKRLFNALFDADTEITTRMQKDSQQEITISSENEPGISIELAPEMEVALPAITLATAHLTPYLPKTGSPPHLTPEYQIPAIDAPEPDDPFDEVYSVATVREKRRRLQGDEEAVFEPKSQKISRVSTFKDLAEAVEWCIRQAGLVASTSAALETEPLGTSDAAADSKGDQLRQRLFGCILLVGGGATGLSGSLIAHWLSRHLRKQLGNTGTTTTVDVLTQGAPNLAWQGAKLMLHTESLSDLWLTPTEWQRFGSRLLREKAPFPW